MRPIRQPTQALLPIPAHPRMQGLSGDPVAFGDLDDRASGLYFQHSAIPLLHDTQLHQRQLDLPRDHDEPRESQANRQGVKHQRGRSVKYQPRKDMQPHPTLCKLSVRLQGGPKTGRTRRQLGAHPPLPLALPLRAGR